MHPEIRKELAHGSTISSVPGGKSRSSSSLGPEFPITVDLSPYRCGVRRQVENSRAQNTAFEATVRLEFIVPQSPATTSFYAEVQQTFVEFALPIRRSLIHLGATPQEAEDAMHNAVVAICDNRPQMERPAAYMMKAARNQWLTMLRSSSRLTELNGEDVPMVAGCTTKTPENQALSHEYQHRVVVALKRLPVAQREAFVLRADERFSYSEIAEITGRKESTVRQQYKRAVAELRSLLEE